MNEDQKITKHIGEQKPLNQNPEPADNNEDNSSNSSSNNNPIKPQETQKGAKPTKK